MPGIPYISQWVEDAAKIATGPHLIHDSLGPLESTP